MRIGARECQFLFRVSASSGELTGTCCFCFLRAHEEVKMDTGANARFFQSVSSSSGTAVVPLPGPVVLPLPSPRFALIIGNNEYQLYGVLNGAVADADHMSEALEALGFECNKLHNQTHAEMLEGMDWLSGKMTANPGCSAILYFAGHGEHVHGIDVLVGTDDKPRYCHKVPIRVCNFPFPFFPFSSLFFPSLLSP